MQRHWRKRETSRKAVLIVSAQARSSNPIKAGQMDEIVSTLRSEARYRPTIWGDARPLLIEAAAKIEQLKDAANAVLKAKADFEVLRKAGVMRGFIDERALRKQSEDAFAALAAAVE
jgi:hypothetical protein